MDILDQHLLSFLIFLPVIAIVLLFFVPKNEKKLLFAIPFVVLLAQFGLSLRLFFTFNDAYSGFQFQEVYPWIESFGIEYFIGVDGVSLLLILLACLLAPIVVLASYSSVKESAKQYLIFLCSLQIGVVGVFCAIDLFLFYLFWELMLIPMYYIIGIWGGGRKIYAAFKFFIYTMVGSVLMLIAILYLYFQAGKTFNLLEWQSQLILAKDIQIYLFLAFALAFAIKVPLFPVHTWLPDAHVQAPTGGSVILAGILLKMGTYGFFRFAMPLFPDAFLHFQPYLIWICVIGVVYGALVAMVQTDIKKLIAYSSVSHLGVVMLGLFSLETTAMLGGLYQMIGHGLSTGALFLVIGMIYERTHSREIKNHSGLALTIPLVSLCFLIATLSSIGLPLTNGFIGEFLTFAGSFQLFPYETVIALSSVVLGAIYMLWLIQRFFFGSLKKPVPEKLIDLKWREALYILPLIVLIFWMGIKPGPFLDKMKAPIDQVVQKIKVVK